MFSAVVVKLLRREVGLHKLRYSKTLRADWAGAFFGAVVGLFIGYLALASVGAVAVDLADLSCLVVFCCIVTTSVLVFSGRARGVAPATTDVVVVLVWPALVFFVS